MHADVHIQPVAHLGLAVQIVVGNVHAANVGRMPVYGDNLAVVAVVGAVDIGEGKGGKLVHQNALGTQPLQVFLGEAVRRTVVAEAVNQHLHLHSLAHLAPQQVEGGIAYAVVVKLVELYVDIAFRLLQLPEQVVEEFLSAGQQMHLVSLEERHVKPTQSGNGQRVAPVLRKTGKSHGKGAGARQQAHPIIYGRKQSEAQEKREIDYIMQRKLSTMPSSWPSSPTTSTA